MIPELQIMGIGIVLVLACVIPGVFLVLRGMSLMSDAISHASLLGIVVVFFLIQNYHPHFWWLGLVLRVF